VAMLPVRKTRGCSSIRGDAGRMKNGEEPMVAVEKGIRKTFFRLPDCNVRLPEESVRLLARTAALMLAL